MADEKPVDEQVRDLLESWNPAPTSDFLARVVGQPVPVGDTRATNAGYPEGADHSRNFANSKIDAERMFADDVVEDDEGDDEALDYSDMTKAELQDEIERRNADRDEDDHLSKSGNKAELVARLEEDDESDESEDDDDE